MQNVKFTFKPVSKPEIDIHPGSPLYTQLLQCADDKKISFLDRHVRAFAHTSIHYLEVIASVSSQIDRTNVHDLPEMPGWVPSESLYSMIWSVTAVIQGLTNPNESHIQCWKSWYMMKNSVASDASAQALMLHWVQSLPPSMVGADFMEHLGPLMVLRKVAIDFPTYKQYSVQGSLATVPYRDSSVIPKLGSHFKSVISGNSIEASLGLYNTAMSAT